MHWFVLLIWGVLLLILLKNLSQPNFLSVGSTRTNNLRAFSSHLLIILSQMPWKPSATYSYTSSHVDCNVFQQLKSMLKLWWSLLTPRNPAAYQRIHYRKMKDTYFARPRLIHWGDFLVSGVKELPGPISWKCLEETWAKRETAKERPASLYQIKHPKTGLLTLNQ